MDPLTIIAAAMSAILFGWVGYFLGNFFPLTAKAKKEKEKREKIKEHSGQKSIFTRFMDWLLEREEEEEEIFDLDEAILEPDVQTPAPTSAEQTEADSDTAIPAPANPTPQPSGKTRTVLIDTPKQAGEDPVVLWHNRVSKKLFAKLENDIIDLDSELSPKEHGTLSMLLVDLQERVGLVATLRDAIAEDTDKVFAEKERKQHLTPEEETPEKPGFNPLRTLVNYVQSDVPKLEEATLSIPEQIDQILQANLAGTHLENKGISVRQWPNRGVVFIVGLDIYEDIHKVPDAEIRNHIRQAVKQWEASQEEEE